MQCTNCGAALSNPDVQAGQCRYCDAAVPRPTAPANSALPNAANFTPLGAVSDLLADRDGDGMPDIVQQVLANARPGAIHTTHVSQQTFVQVVRADGSVHTQHHLQHGASPVAMDVSAVVSSLQRPAPSAAASARGTSIGLAIVALLAVGVVTFLLLSL